MNIIETHELTKYYVRPGLKKRQTMGIEQVSFAVRRGEIFGFLGPNGAGKTTTMRILLDLIRPTGGTASVLGLDAQKDTVEIRRHVGYIPGEILFYEGMTAGDLLRYYEQLMGAPATRKGELVSLFDIPLDRPVKTFSKGMKQKIAIVQAFMHDPELVIMDEPSSGLDPLVQQRFYDFLLRERASGKTIFLSTHILGEAQRVCDRVAIIRKGRIAAIEDVAELRAKSGKRITVTFEGPVDEADIMTPEVRDVAPLEDGYVLHTGSRVTKTLRRIAALPVADISIEETSLEDIFMHYYDGDGDV